MFEILTGPVAFAIWFLGFALGSGLLAFFFRQGWLVLAVSLFGMGLSVPGWLTAVGSLGAVFCVVGYWQWAKRNLGYSL